MSKKKRFGISEALTRGLSETINVVENNAGVFRNVILPLSRIELDPDNPRKLAIDLLDVKEGIRPDDPLYHHKQQELEKLKELAHTIKSSGVINPIVVFKLGELYRVVAGERRCLASILAGKQDIEARIFNEKPKGFELKLIQWIENTAREDLTLYERLENVKEMIREYKNQHGPVDVTATLLKNITGLSLPQMTYYLAAIHAPEDVQIEIKKGNIRNLDKAALIANAPSADLRREAILACIDGSSLKAIRGILSQEKIMKRNKVSEFPSKRGPATLKINMGTTIKSEVVKTLVDLVMTQRKYDKYLGVFSKVNWSDMRQASNAFRKLIEIMELEVV